LFFVFETGSLYVAQAGLEQAIPLPLPLKCWDYRCTPPYLVNLCFLVCLFSKHWVPMECWVLGLKKMVYVQVVSKWILW
jgi:hypothetical protein